ncbi:MAG: hypothetical protein P8X64_12780, partial [Anaerolineales bacterium]
DPCQFALRYVPMAMLALFLCGCGTAPEMPAPAPTALPTAASLPTETPAPSPTMQVQTDRVSFAAADGADLSGMLFAGVGAGDIGVVLAHMGAHGANQSSWAVFARHAALQGFGALTFNFRADRSRLALDVQGAIEFLREQGYRRIACVGASMGGTACIKAAADSDLDGLVVISSLWTTGSGPTGGALVVSSQELAQLALPKLFVTAENDGSGVPATIKQMYAVASEPKALQIFPGSMHGTDIFATAQGEELRDLLVDFLDHLR